MDQLFIRIKKGERCIDIDINKSTHKERHQWYESLSKGQIISVLEQFVSDKIMEENKL